MNTNNPIKRGRGRPPNSHDNRAVRAWLRQYWDALDFCTANPRAEDALTGAANLRTQGDTGNGLSTRKLFHILRSLDFITSQGVAECLGCAERTAQVYVLAASIASRAIEVMASNGLPGTAPIEDEDGADYMVPDVLERMAYATEF